MRVFKVNTVKRSRRHLSTISEDGFEPMAFDVPLIRCEFQIMWLRSKGELRVYDDVRNDEGSVYSYLSNTDGKGSCVDRGNAK